MERGYYSDQLLVLLAAVVLVLLIACVNVASILLGTAAGLGLGRLGRDLLLAGAPGPRPFWMDFALDLRVGGFVVGLSVLTALLFGLAPSLYAVRTSPARLLRSGGERSGEGNGR